MRFVDKVVQITGAGSGIGRATAIKFAREGAKVVVADLNGETADETAAIIKQAGGQALPVAVNVAVPADVEKMLESTITEFGNLDCAFNNAGIDQSGRETADQLDTDTWDRILDVNLKGVFLCMHVQLRHMIAHGGGSIVNTSSGAGIKGVPGMGAYCASKHGVIGLSRASALDHARQGIRINVVCPGLIRTNLLAETFTEMPELEQVYTEMQPYGRQGEPEEIADAVLWL